MKVVLSDFRYQRAFNAVLAVLWTAVYFATKLRPFVVVAGAVLCIAVVNFRPVFGSSQVEKANK